MTNFHRLKNQLIELYSLTRLQRSLRLLLRAFWLSIAGGILGWGINALTGWIPNPAGWILIGLGFALIPIVIILVSLYPVLFSLAPNKQWVWKMDRHLGMREQLSTAWEMAEKETQHEKNLVSDLLVQDMLAGMPGIRTEMMKGGWYHKADLASSVVVLLLACLLFASLLFRPDPNIQTQNPQAPAPQAIQPQPGAEEEGAPQGQQPGEGEQSQPGDQPGAGEAGEQPGEESGESSQPGSESGGGGEGGQTAGSGTEPADAEALADALREMGSELSRQAGTFELGQALENLDMDRSAQALEDLNQQLEELSPETRENMAQAMQEAADAIEEAGEPELSQNMDKAAESLPEADAEANEALGNVADDLRQLEGAMQAASGASTGAGEGQSSETGSPEPVERLSEEGGNFDLPQDSGTQSDLLSPAPPDAAGEDTAGGSLDSTGRPGEDVIQNPIIPNALLWKWRDVVSQYFQR